MDAAPARAVIAWLGAVLLVAAAGPQDDDELPLVVVERVGTVIERDSRVRIAPGVLATRGDEAAIVVRTNGVYLAFEDGVLEGASEDTPPEEMDGVGVLVEARHVTIDGLRVRGYKVGVLARKADGLNLIDVSVDGGFRQRLGSTWEREDAADWLRPHDNDEREWRRRYGAGLVVEDTLGVLVSMCRIRGVQNGIVLDRVEEAVVTSNDASFLSGWGLAMWRTRTSLIAGNRFDFCVRGYSHGRYNRGQDSAGILLFEQCSDNTFERNSATHGGDGVFGFAGREALGETPPPRERFDYTARGSNHNVFERNDLSYAAAHGFELTFSFGNTIRWNRLVGNAICGIWLGYGRDSLIEGNLMAENGGARYGSERGGLNAEHAQRLVIRGNLFQDQDVGVRIWTDPDGAIAKLPWTVANGRGARDNELVENLFENCEYGIELVDVAGTLARRNVYSSTPRRISTRAMDEAEGMRLALEDPGLAEPEVDWPVLRAERIPPARSPFAGRQWIVVGPYGPHDWEVGAPWLQPMERTHAPRYRLIAAPPGEGRPAPRAELIEGDGAWVLESVPDEDGIAIGCWKLTPAALPHGDGAGALAPYALAVTLGDSAPLVARGAAVHTSWDIRIFPTPFDPREDEAAFERAASEAKVLTTRPDLDLALRFGPGHFLGIDQAAERELGLGPDHYGVRVTTRVRLPAGRYVVRTVSDDGVRVRADGEVVLVDWTHHAPRAGEGVLEIAEARDVEFVVDHFQLTGHAELRFELLPAP